MRVHTMQNTLREMSSRANNPKLTTREREHAQSTLRTMRARFDDASIVEAIEYDARDWDAPETCSPPDARPLSLDSDAGLDWDSIAFATY